MNDQRDNADGARVPDYATVVRQRDEAVAELARIRGILSVFFENTDAIFAKANPNRTIGHTLNPKGGGPCE